MIDKGVSKLKKAFSALLSVILCFSFIVMASANDDDFVIEDGALTEYRGDEYRVVVPKGVRILREGVLSGKSMTELELPDSLERIEQYALFGSGNLKTVVIPKNVKEIGVYVFDGCTSLTSIETAAEQSYFKSADGVLFDKTGELLVKFPEGKPTAGYRTPDTVRTIGDGAFYATDLTAFTVGDSVETVRSWAFGDCPKLTEVTVGSNVKTLGSHVFSGSGRLASVTLPAALETIGSFAFDNCTGLKTIRMAEDGRSFASVDGVLYSRDGTTLVKYPEGRSAKGFRLPDTVSRLAVGAFTRCDFTEIDLKNVTYIDDYSLNECKALRTVSFGAGLTHVGQGAFVNDTALKDVFYEGDSAKWDKIECKGDNQPLQNATMHYGGSAPPADRTGAIGDPWSPEDLPAAGNIVFQDNWGDALPFTLDDNGTLTISGSGATYGYSTKEFQTGVWSPGMPLPIRSPLYYYRDEIRRVVLTGGLTILGDNVFYECSRITDVYFDGTEEEWNAVDIREGNECLTGATFHFRRAEPTAKEVTVTPLPDSAQPPELDTSVFSFNAGLDGGNLTGRFRYAAGQAIAYDCYFTLITGSEGGEFTINFPLNGKDDLYRFAAAPLSAYRLTYSYGFTIGSGSANAVVAFSDSHDRSGERQITVNGGALRSGYLSVILLKQDFAAADPDPATPDPPTPTYQPGDVDGSGDVTSADARLALRASVHLEHYEKDSTPFLAADVDGSGTIGPDDARTILRASVHLEDLSKMLK